MMTLDDVKARLAEIAESAKDDDESAHACEDDLHQDVLQAIADGHPDAAALAAEALKSVQITFYRWYA